jgi:hypothetical protein
VSASAGLLVHRQDPAVCARAQARVAGGSKLWVPVSSCCPLGRRGRRAGRFLFDRVKRRPLRSRHSRSQTPRSLPRGRLDNVRHLGRVVRREPTSREENGSCGLADGEAPPDRDEEPPEPRCHGRDARCHGEGRAGDDPRDDLHAPVCTREGRLAGPPAAACTCAWLATSATVAHRGSSSPIRTKQPRPAMSKASDRLLRRDPKLSAGDPDRGNLLVEGDNLEALKTVSWAEALE